MVFELKETEEFTKQFQKLPLDIQNRFQKQFIKIKNNPFSIGKPLTYKWFRELKNKNYRAYYIVYKQKIIVMLVAISNKKTQQNIINAIKAKFINNDNK